MAKKRRKRKPERNPKQHKPQKRKRGRPRGRKPIDIAARRATEAAARRNLTKQGQDIGEIPACKNPERRAAAGESYEFFCKTYFPKIFYLKWSKDLLKVISKIELVIINHDMVALAMPRGSGKSSLCRCAVLWAVLFVLHKYALLIGATAPDAAKALVWFKAELTDNELLYEDFPEVCYPIRLLENETRRCMGQRYKGAKTNIRWGKDHIVLPTIPGSGASGSVIDVASLEGAIRGRWIRTPDGKIVRPTLVLPDDPQTAETARSQGPSGQTTYRIQTIKQDVQGLAGPDQQTAMLIPCTVIEPGDLADQLLNRKLNPEFRGERMKRLYSWPTNKALWEEYRELRDRAMQTDQSLEEATEFYRQRRCSEGRRLDEAGECSGCPNKANCMDCGAVVDWVERLDDPRNLTAVQAAMHAFYKYGPKGFAAEFQNEPLANDGSGQRLTAELCAARVSGRAWGEVPIDCTELTCGIDVQQHSLWYTIVAWKPNFSGHVVEYGIWPEQTRPVITKSEIEKSFNNLQMKYPNMGVEGAIRAGLNDLVSRLLARNFQRSGGAGLMRISNMLVDSGTWPDEIHAVKLARGGATMWPSRGEGIGAGGKQMPARTRKAGERWDPAGRWYFPSTTGTREFPTCVLDTNFWKSKLHQAFLTAPGDPGAITLPGSDPDRHFLFASHQVAETFTTPRTPKGIAVDEWTLRPSRPDNEWWDCNVYAMVAASMRGCKHSGNDSGRPARIVTVKRARWEKVMA